MKTLSVGELKAQFSEVLEMVKAGESVEILFGKKRQPVAMIVPIDRKKKGKRKIGIYEGKTAITLAEDFEITEVELANLK